MLTIARLGAFLGHVPVFIAVSALHVGHVAGLIALSGLMTLLVAVTAYHLARLLTVTSHVTLLAAVVAGATAAPTLGAVAGEGTSYVFVSRIIPNGRTLPLTFAALSALDTFGGAGLRACGSQ